MEKWKALLADLPTSPEGLLLALAQYTAQSAEAVPHVTLHLRNGRDVTGLVVGRKEHRGIETWVLEARTDERFPDDLVLVPAAQVDAVTLHQASRLAALIQQKKPAPSTLELQRLTQEAARAVSEACGKPLVVELDTAGQKPEGDAAKGVALWLERSSQVLVELCGADRGKKAVAGLAGIVLEQGDAFVASKRGERLVISGPLLLGVAQVASDAELRRGVEAAL